VHGLNGHPIASFTTPATSASSTDCFWLRDLLPRDLPRSRIYSWGHNASVPELPFRDLAMNLADHLGQDVLTMPGRSRPLIFLAHSLGGLIVKQLLVLAPAYHRYEPIVARTLGILFLGTPHRGSSTATWAETMSRLVTGVREQSQAIKSKNVQNPQIPL
jgi:protein SERAC1